MTVFNLVIAYGILFPPPPNMMQHYRWTVHSLFLPNTKSFLYCHIFEDPFLFFNFIDGRFFTCQKEVEKIKWVSWNQNLETNQQDENCFLEKLRLYSNNFGSSYICKLMCIHKCLYKLLFIIEAVEIAIKTIY